MHQQNESKIAKHKLWETTYRYVMRIGTHHIRRKYTSIARGGSGDYSPPIGLPTKNQSNKSTMFLALLRLSFALEWIQKIIYIKHILKRLLKGGEG